MWWSCRYEWQCKIRPTFSIEISMCMSFIWRRKEAREQEHKKRAWCWHTNMDIKKTVPHNLAILFMLQKIREIVLQLFLFYFKLERRKKIIPFRFVAIIIYDNTTDCPARRSKQPQQQRQQQPSNIKMPFSIFHCWRNEFHIYHMECLRGVQSHASHCIRPHPKSPRDM